MPRIAVRTRRLTGARCHSRSPSEERVGVVAGPTAGWQGVELVDVPASEDDVLWLERGDETADDVLDVLPPLREPVT